MYAGFAALMRGADVAAYVRTFYDPACEYYPVEESDPIRGHDELIRWNSRWFEAWDAFDVELEDVVPVGDKLMTEIRVEGRGGGSGLEVGRSFFHLFEMREGKIFRMHEYETRRDALQAAGA
jgi:ketosteroid isomerase-like protein